MTFARLGLGLLLAIAALPAAAADVNYELINDSSLVVMYFQTSPSAEPSWGDDILGAEVLAPGESATVTIFDGSEICAFDVKFTFDDGQELVDQVDVCDMASYTLYDAE